MRESQLTGKLTCGREALSFRPAEDTVDLTYDGFLQMLEKSVDE